MYLEARTAKEMLLTITPIYKMNVFVHIILSIITLGMINIYVTILQSDAMQDMNEGEELKTLFMASSILLPPTMIMLVLAVLFPVIAIYALVLAGITKILFFIYSITVARTIEYALPIPKNSQMKFSRIAVLLFGIYYINYKINDILGVVKVMANNEDFYALECNKEMLKLKQEETLAPIIAKIKGGKSKMSDEHAIEMAQKEIGVQERDNLEYELPLIDFQNIKASIKYCWKNCKI
jgi:hypothetical protein